MPIVRLEFSLFLFPSSFGTHSCPGTLPEDALEALDVVVSTSFWKSANNKATIWTVIEATSLTRVLVIILAVELPAMSSFEQDRHYPALERMNFPKNTDHLGPPAFSETKTPKLPKTRLFGTVAWSHWPSG
jgi:hypothetical protein